MEQAVVFNFMPPGVPNAPFIAFMQELVNVHLQSHVEEMIDLTTP